MRKIIVFALVVVLIGLLILIKVPTLMITSEGSVEDFFFYEEEAELKVRWQHSVEKEDWEEMFQLRDGVIELTGTRFKTFGAGVPNDAGDETYIKDGWVYMTGIERTIGKQLAIRTGEHTDHRLTYGKDTTIQLDKNQAYQISVRKPSALATIKNYIFVKLG